MSQVQRDQLRVVAEKAVLVAVQLPGRYFDETDPLGELRALAETAGALVVGELLQKRDKPSGRTYLGKGKAEELAQLVAVTGATLVIFDNDLSPSQIKAIEYGTECKVIDRSELILDIFANRAATHAAKLQVEIAQLQYTYPRLRAMWDHLENIAGGAPIGIGTRGPGEKQLEIDRRLVQMRLRNLKRELVRIQQRKTREVERRNLDHYTVGLVGYTNAGKSTLFNRLTRAEVFVGDMMFATLDPTMRRVRLPSGLEIILSDTVGFISALPTELVAAFRATLEEVVEADLIIHVRDVSGLDSEAQRRDVEAVLEYLDLGDKLAESMIEVLNKIDLLEGEPRGALCGRAANNSGRVVVSALTGEGMANLLSTIDRRLTTGGRTVSLSVALEDGAAIAWLYGHGQVIGRRDDEELAHFRINLDAADLARFRRRAE